MDDVDILEALFDLASEAGFEIRTGGRLSPDDPPLESGVCRLRGRLYIVLSANESVSMQIETLGSALGEHAAEILEQRHLPPAIRSAIESPRE